MEMSNQDVEMPVPINTSYGHGHIVPYKKMVKYKECLKNHAAAMGGTATDGCGEFMASGEEGTPEAFTCSVCTCHRNFHRKETQGDTSYYHKKVFLGHHIGTPSFVSSRPTQPHSMIMSYNMMMGSTLASESDEQEDGGGNTVHGCGYAARVPSHMARKRFRTKFSQEQKEKMVDFAERVGWKMQNLEESVVQQICQEVGVKRKVLKVWMHNNKHHLSKINPTTSSSASTPTV